jgi:hypothetical protein
MCAKKWTKIGQNLGAKAMLSLWTQITLPKLGKKKKTIMPKNESHYQA